MVHGNGASVSIRTSPSVPSTSSALLVLISRPISSPPPVRFHRDPLVRTFFAAPHTDEARVGPSCATSGLIVHARPRGYHERHRVSADEHTTCACRTRAQRSRSTSSGRASPSAPTANILCSMSQPFPTLPRPFPVPCDTLHAESTMCVTALCRSVLSWSALRSTHPSASFAVVRQNLGPDRVQVADDDVRDEGGADGVGVVVREQSRHVVERVCWRRRRRSTAARTCATGAARYARELVV